MVNIGIVLVFGSLLEDWEFTRSPRAFQGLSTDALLIFCGYRERLWPAQSRKASRCSCARVPTHAIRSYSSQPSDEISSATASQERRTPFIQRHPGPQHKLAEGIAETITELLAWDSGLTAPTAPTRQEALVAK